METVALWSSTIYQGPPRQKLLTYLRSTLGLSVTLVRKLKQANAILVNGNPEHVDYLLIPGDRVEITAIAEEPGLPGEDLPLDIVYEDPYLLVVNKPAGMVAHPVKHYTSGTLANALAYYLSQGEHSRQVRLVHRLDRDTSGLLVVSLNPIVHDRLIKALQQREIHRIYWALVDGELPAKGTIDAPIDREVPGSVRHIVRTDGKPAVTHFKAIKTWGKKASLAQISLETGRTHQIRVHMAHIGHPLLGDHLYGDPKGKGPINRQALHARQIIMPHPVTGELLDLSAPVPDDIDRLIRIYDRYAELGL